jgi:hypothetical protein
MRSARLGDSGTPIGAGQVQATIAELDQIQRSAAQILADNRSWFEENSAALTTDQRNRYSQQLSVQLAAVQAIGKGLISLQQKAGDNGYLGNLGILPAIPLTYLVLTGVALAVLAAFSLAAVIYAVSTFRTSAAESEAIRSAAQTQSQTVAAINTKVQNGTANAQDYAYLQLLAAQGLGKSGGLQLDSKTIGLLALVGLGAFGLYLAMD